ncbi:MAG: NTP transferase domain-containing protein [Bacteroidales bacterium]|nr:NTP transferase domain-containing protein [Bacteroidales bacterium]
MSNNYIVIMAGGIGSRFWPYSRTVEPKQFLDILGIGETLIQSTYNRFKNIAPPENILVVTNDIYLDLVKKQLPEIPHENLLAEPMRRNTAPCIAFANAIIKKKNPQAQIIVTPADHLILDIQKFEDTILDGINFAMRKKALLTLGIKPTRPETGYGYIQADEMVEDRVFKVKTFTEKPNKELAETFVSSGEFSWNSGIFIWSLDTIDNSFMEYQPEIYKQFSKLENNYTSQILEGIYGACPSISIDYGIMEHAKNVFIMEANFRWSDLGTWSALYDNSDKDENDNVLGLNNILTYNVEQTVVKDTGKKFIVLEGLKGYIFVETDDVIMVCRKEEEQNIKQFVNDIRLKKREDLL